MPEITEDVVRKIARLSNLKLTPEEIVQYAGQLGNILAYIQQLNEVDTLGVPETAHALELYNVWREDRPGSGLDREQVLAAAPDAQDGCFRVPRIIE